MEDNKKHDIRRLRHRWPDEIAAQKKKTRTRFLIACGFLLCFLAGVGVSYLGGDAVVSNASKEQRDKYDEVYDIMLNEWYFGKDIEDLDDFLTYNALLGLTSNEYDAHTNYLYADVASDYLQGLEGSLVGIGVLYSKMGEEALIEKVYADSPAKKAGVQSGDQIIKVNGIVVADKSADEIAALVQGEEGTSVSIEFKRGNETFTKDLVRSSVNTSVYGYIKDGVGILEFSRFTQHSAEEFEVYLKEFEKAGIDDIIIDLRDNSGGYLETMVQVASMFLKEDTLILQEEDRSGNISKHYTKQAKRFDYDQLVLLVNQDTASASEALAAALKEQGERVSVIGVRTYGKGTVQEPIVFADGSYLKYTVAQWLTPNGEKINKVGIKPDIEVKLDEAITCRINEKDGKAQLDEVSVLVKDAQVLLSFLGYDVDRKDGYYSVATQKAVKKYQQDMGIKADGIIDFEYNKQLFVSAREKWLNEKATLDTQMIKALEVANGR